MSAESLFLKFRESGEPAALGAAFDLVADELYAVALHLCRDHGDAEDLLQATFLLGIERAERYQAGRPLKPWLLGILFREAKAMRRRRRRRVDPGRVARPVTVEPLDEVLSAETRSQVAQAIAEVPQPYRQVLELHLLEALPQGEIAQRLRRSPGTVRTQLWRGLGRLRRLLPASIALGLSTRLQAGTGLAAVRQEVLRAANAKAALGASGSGGIFLTGVLLMSNKVLPALVVLIACSAWVLRPRSPEVTAAAPSTTAAPASAPADAEPQTETGVPRQSLPDQDAGQARVPVAGPAAAGKRLIRIEVVDSRADSVADAEVLVFHEGQRRTPERSLRTDTRGCVELRSAGVLLVRAQRDGLGRTDLVRIGGSKAAQEVELRLILRQPLRIHGRVLGVDGRPAAGAQVRCSLEESYPRPYLAVAPPAVASAADGRFEFELVEGREYSFVARQDGRYSDRVWVDTQQRSRVKDPAELLLRFPGAFSLRGTLRDARGEACAGEVILLRTGSKVRGRDHLTRKVAAGKAFEFLLVEAGSYQLVGGREGETAAEQTVTLSVAHPHRELELRTSPFVPVRGQAVDEAGEPCTGLRVSCYPSDKQDPLQRNRNRVQGRIHGTTTDGEGNFSLLLPRGQRADLRYHPNRYISVRSDQLIPPAAGLLLRVTRASCEGFELAGRVLDATDGRLIPEFKAYLISESRPGCHSDSRVADGTDGSFALGPFPAGKKYWLRIEAAGYAPGVIGPFDGTRRRETRDLRLSRAATLHCTVLRPDGQPAFRARVSLSRVGPRVPFARAHQRWSDKAGRVELSAIAPGRYTVHAQAQATAGGGTKQEVELHADQRAHLVLRLQR